MAFIIAQSGGFVNRLCKIYVKCNKDFCKAAKKQKKKPTRVDFRQTAPRSPKRRLRGAVAAGCHPAVLVRIACLMIGGVTGVDCSPKPFELLDSGVLAMASTTSMPDTTSPNAA